jgi:hypothetical protein
MMGNDESMPVGGPGMTAHEAVDAALRYARRQGGDMDAAADEWLRRNWGSLSDAAALDLASHAIKILVDQMHRYDEA